MRARSILAAIAVAAGTLIAGSAPPASAATTKSTRWLLNHLTVGGTNHSGYDRDKFKLWDYVGDGCDVRDRVLIRDAIKIHVGPDCQLRGTWRSPYDGTTTTNPTQVQIDHVVPLANAWRSGAWKWNAATRERFANDLGTRYSLLAVSAHSNLSKRDRDPSEYLPPRAAFTCKYETYYVAVLWRWRLHISPSLKAFLADDLRECGWPRIHEPPRPVIGYRSTTSTGGGGTGGSTTCTKTSSGSCIAAGQFCRSADEGHYGYDAQGRRLKCYDGHWHYA